MNKTGIVILNYNNNQDTINCIKSFLAVNTHPFKIVVVDNNSEERDYKKMLDFLQGYNVTILNGNVSRNQEYKETFFLIRSDTNLGYACGNNLGVRFLFDNEDVDKIVIVNNDVLFVDDVIPVLRRFEEKTHNVGILSPILYKRGMEEIDYTCARKSPNDWMLILKYLLMDLRMGGLSEKFDEKNYLLKRNPNLINSDSIPIDLPSGSCMYIDKTFFKSIGAFDPKTFLYYEENILYKKIQRENKQNYILPNIRCIHLGAMSTKSKPSSFLIKCNSDSAFYYLYNYCNLNWLKKIAINCAKKMMTIKYRIFKNKEH